MDAREARKNAMLKAVPWGTAIVVIQSSIDQHLSEKVRYLWPCITKCEKLKFRIHGYDLSGKPKDISPDTTSWELHFTPSTSLNGD